MTIDYTIIIDAAVAATNSGLASHLKEECLALHQRLLPWYLDLQTISHEYYKQQEEQTKEPSTATISKTPTAAKNDRSTLKKLFRRITAVSNQTIMGYRKRNEPPGLDDDSYSEDSYSEYSDSDLSDTSPSTTDEPSIHLTYRRHSFWPTVSSLARQSCRPCSTLADPRYSHGLCVSRADLEIWKYKSKPTSFRPRCVKVRPRGFACGLPNKQLDDDVAPRTPEGVNVLPPHRTASDPLEHNLLAASETGAESSPEEARAFKLVDGLSELAVTTLRCAGFEKLLPSQKHVLESIEFRNDRRTSHHKVIVSRFAAGKTTLLCLAGFVAVMRCSDDDFQPPTTEGSPPGAGISHAAPPSENSSNTSPSSAAANPSVLMAVPLPENARDAGAFLDQLLKYHGSSCAAIVGDVLTEADFTALSKWPTAVIGTFDKLLDLIVHGHLDLSGLLYLAIDDLDTSLQVLHKRLPECQVVVTSSSMTQDLVAPILTLIKPNSPLPAVVRMGRIPNSSLVIDGEVVSQSSIQEMTCLELLKEFGSARQAH
ncbi:hypothetical protein KCU77_g1981, partial [Aureobasidium melanogenum]